MRRSATITYRKAVRDGALAPVCAVTLYVLLVLRPDAVDKTYFTYMQTMRCACAHICRYLYIFYIVCVRLSPVIARSEATKQSTL